MKTREQIIHSMCMTYRHDYGLRCEDTGNGFITAGVTDDERKAIWNQMAQIFDNDIAPYMEFKRED